MPRNKIAENRWWNFRQLVRMAGGNNAAARRLGMGETVVQAYAGPNARRNIGDKIAQKIEIRFGITQDGRCLVIPEGNISKRNAAILADTMFLQASALTRFSLSSG